MYPVLSAICGLSQCSRHPKKCGEASYPFQFPVDQVEVHFVSLPAPGSFELHIYIYIYIYILCHAVAVGDGVALEESTPWFLFIRGGAPWFYGVYVTPSVSMVSMLNLVGGLEHFLFFHILGIIIPTDFHIFQRG